MNTIFKKRQIAILFFLTALLFTNCEETNVENCITDMQIDYVSKNPGPDVVSFKIRTNYEQLKFIDSIVVSFNDKDIYSASAQFELERVESNEYLLKWMTPYFAQKGCHTEKQFYSLYEKSASLKIVLSNEKDTFTFVKCDN